MQLGRREHAGNAGMQEGCELRSGARSIAGSRPLLTLEELRHLFQVTGVLLSLCGLACPSCQCCCAGACVCYGALGRGQVERWPARH